VAGASSRSQRWLGRDRGRCSRAAAGTHAAPSSPNARPCRSCAGRPRRGRRSHGSRTRRTRGALLGGHWVTVVARLFHSQRCDNYVTRANIFFCRSLRPFICVALTGFRHVRKRPFIACPGGWGQAECGASAEGWRERSALRGTLSSGTLLDYLHCVADGRRSPQPPSPSGVRKPRAYLRGFCFAPDGTAIAW
jgi:hypothetical protein